MSNKEAAIDLIKKLPDNVTVEGIVACLQDEHARALASAAEQEEELEWSAEELSEDEWMAFVADNLRDELNDPREDIYTLEDGEPPNAER